MPALAVADTDAIAKSKRARAAETLGLVARGARGGTVDAGIAVQISARKAAVAGQRRAGRAGSAARDVEGAALAGVGLRAEEDCGVVADAEARSGHRERLAEDQVVGAAGADSGTAAKSARRGTRTAGRSPGVPVVVVVAGAALRLVDQIDRASLAVRNESRARRASTC